METRTDIINEIRTRLSFYNGSYPFFADDDIDAETKFGNCYVVDEINASDDDDITINILTEWGNKVQLKSDMFTTESLLKLRDNIAAPKTLWASGHQDNVIYKNDNILERFFTPNDALQMLKKTFNLPWEWSNDSSDDVWCWVYYYNNKVVLTATFG